ncbi:MAG TPA: hypothetical protein VER58_18325, partial [Thermoanaerobaculia bacterium]|nr:hypothetical protein [Thermoanaerobaculia bacterium]
IANPAYEIFYPPQWLILVGSYPFGFALHIVAHVAIALCGMYAFLRSIPLRVEAAMFGALSFGLSGFFFGTMTNLPTFFVWAWAGVVGWAVLRLIRTGAIAMAALALAMPMLIFEPMALAQMLALVIAGAAYADRRSLPRVFGAIGLAIAISAVVIVPAIDHAHDSVRSRGFSHDLAIDYSMPAARPLELVAPRIFGVLPDIRTWWGYRLFGHRGTPYLMSIYCGVAVAMLALAAFAKRMRGWTLVLAICATSYLLAIGSPLFDWVWAASRHSIRYPEKFIGAALVTLIVFASIVLDRIVEMRRTAIVVAVVVAAVLWLLAPVMSINFSGFWHAPDYLEPLARGELIFSACIATMWAIVIWKFGTSRIYAWIAALLLLIDFGSLSNEILPRMPRRFLTPPPIARSLEPGSTIFHRGEWTQEKLERQFERANQPLAMRNGLRGHTPALWGFRSALEPDIDGTDLLPTYDLLDAMLKRGNAGDPHWSEPFVRISNVREVLDYAGASIDNPLIVTRVANNGRYWFAKRTGKIVGIAEASSTATLDVEATETSLLIITITRHKYWHATIDGRPAELMPANIAYQSLSVPPGRHRVEVRYRNPLVGWSAAVSALGLIALIPRRRRPRNES